MDNYTSLNLLLDCKDQMASLLNICRDDFDSPEARQQAKELEELINQDSQMNLVSEEAPIGCVNRLTIMCYRGWLFTWKNRGYVIFDASNGHYSYGYTAEDFLIHMMTDVDLDKFETDEYTRRFLASKTSKQK